MKNFIKFFVIAAVILSTVSCFAEIPHLINYQGKLTDTAGKSVTDGTYSVTFRIYDAESAGNLLWEEAQTVSVQKGIFSVLLGGVSALSLAFDKPYWLEIKVGTEVMSPRQRMASVGYAVRSETSQNADTVANIGASTTPTANKLLPLDSNAKIPSAVLPFKVYDSGWFAVTSNSRYTLTHNLGTTKAIFQLKFSLNSDGSGAAIMGDRTGMSGDSWINLCSSICNITQNTCTLSTSNLLGFYYDQNGNQIYPASGYCKITALALE